MYFVSDVTLFIIYFRSYFVRAIDINENAILFDTKLNKDSQYKCPRSYQHHFSTGKNGISLKFRNKIDADKFRKSIEEKIIELKLKRRVCKTFAEGANNTIGTPPRQNVIGSSNIDNLTLTSDVSRILRRSQSFCEGGEIEKQILVENFLNLEPDCETSAEMENGKSVGSEEQNILGAGQTAEKENKWNLIRKRILFTAKKDHLVRQSTLPSSPTDFKHLSHVGWNPNRFGQPIHHTGLTPTKEENVLNNERLEIKVLSPIGMSKPNELKDRKKLSSQQKFESIMDRNISSPDDSEYHKISNFFKSEECLNDTKPSQNGQDVKEDNIQEECHRGIAKECILEDDNYHEISEPNFRSLQRDRSTSQPNKADLDWESTLGNLRKSIASISGPRLKQSEESALDISPKDSNIMLQ